MKSKHAALIGIIATGAAVLFLPTITVDVFCGIDGEPSPSGGVAGYLLRTNFSPVTYLIYLANGERVTINDVVCGN